MQHPLPPSRPRPRSWKTSLAAAAVLLACLPAVRATDVAVTTVTSLTANTPNPQCTLVQGSDGNFYGTTSSGGPNGYGTIFKVIPSGEVTILHNLGDNGAADAVHPLAGLIQGSDGNFYGTAAGAAAFGNAVFQITPAGVFTKIHTLGGNEGIGANGRLLQLADGSFYGTTNSTVFHLTPDGVTITLLNDGAHPFAGLTPGNDGNLYGTTTNGGTGGQGTVFQFTPDGVRTTLHNFTGTPDGATVYAGLTLGGDGNLYGATLDGGANGFGMVYRISPTGVFTDLHDFSGPDGGQPFAEPVQGDDGNFYGTTRFGGAHSGGVLYQLTPAGVYTVLHSFGGGGADGLEPRGGLIQAADGSFYGTTRNGGTTGYGTIYKLTLSPTINSPATAAGSVGEAFNYQITTVGGRPGAYTAAGLPAGLSIERSTGLISGTPTTVGTFQVMLGAGNLVGTGAQTLTLMVTATAPPPSSDPVATLAVTTPTAAVGGGQAGVYTVSIPAALDHDVIVHYAVKGSAVNGVDYVFLKGTKKIKAGKTSKPIKVIPQGDLGGAARLSVKLFLTEGDGYTVGTTDKLKVTIFAAAP